MRSTSPTRVRRPIAVAMLAGAALVALNASPAPARGGTPAAERGAGDSRSRARVIRVLSSGEITRVGSYRPDGGTGLGRAIRAFGRPSSRHKVGDGRTSCKVRWSKLGLTVTSTNFGLAPEGHTTCEAAHGKVQVIRLAGKRAGRAGWRTNRGLRIGSSLRRLKRLYRRADHGGRGTWHLISADLPIGVGPTPILTAKVTKRHVTSFEVWVGGAGD